MTSRSNDIFWDLEQGSLEWFELRNERYPASESGAVMDVNPKWMRPKNKRELAAFRRGELHIEENWMMSRGKRYEEEARDWLQDMLQMELRPCVAVAGDYMASLDGLSPKDGSVAAEIKVPVKPAKLFSGIAEAARRREEGEPFAEWIKELPANYLWQMVQQAHCVPQTETMVFCAYDPTVRNGIYIMIEADDLRAQWTALEAQWEVFRGSNYEPLDVDMSKDEAWRKAAKRWSELNAQLKQAIEDAGIRELEKAVKDAAKELKDVCEPGIPNVGCGIKVGYSDVPEKRTKGYVMKRISGTFSEPV